MPRKDHDQDERRQKLEAAQAQLARHERLSRVALLLILLLSVVLLALVVNNLWNHPYHKRASEASCHPAFCEIT
ncbi:hypothetical protein HPT29_025550 (plasmid) [Microvirga terrae]|uniref:Uncharacterized protein n=1 Tax=Microvirga terrae TaxID=2740529 RepID=A0ABY5S075_9HYPH|nr:hypothetical protein [Microvirga terrae]UVF22517.1 hypothetical protein HPT29_025550 [Microvirga terrae]